MKKIMFNDKYGLTQAVLEGRKTQTRRIAYDGDIKPRVGYGLHNAEEDKCILLDNWMQVAISNYKIGEEVAIAQSYKDARVDPFFLLSPLGDGVYAIDSNGWDNKMFVRADLMLHRIKITNIRVERLQDISEEDCLKEGIKRKNERYVIENEKGVCFYTNDPILAFRFLIDKTCGKGTWERNPYVFVYDFELIN